MNDETLNTAIDIKKQIAYVEKILANIERGKFVEIMFANAGCCCASSCCELLTDEEVDRYRKDIAECFRVLRPGGFLIFKWNETDIKVSEVLKLNDQKPIFGHKSGKRANTHWIYFMKGI